MVSDNLKSEPRGDAVRQHVERILASKPFHKKEMLARFLRYIVQETIEGRASRISQYSIGIDALGYGPSDDFDTTVRAHARRLRGALEEYYAGPGSDDHLHIQLPKGHYIPLFQESHVTLPPPPIRREGGLTAGVRRHYWRGWIAASGLAITLLGTGATLRFFTAGQPRYEIRQITHFASDTHSPAVSPDGAWIVYASDHSGDGNSDIWLKSMHSKERDIRLTSHRADDYDPDISPDGKWVVFRSQRDGGGVYLVPADGKRARKLNDGFEPRFSPDGQLIAYSVIESSGNASVFVGRPEGGPGWKIGSGFQQSHCPVWSPDGRRLMLNGVTKGAGGRSEYDWWLVTVDGKGRSPTGAREALAPAIGQMTSHTCPSDWVGQKLLARGTGKIVELTLDAQGRRFQQTAEVLHPGPHADWARYRRGGRKGFLFGAGEGHTQIWAIGADGRTGKVTGTRELLTNDQSLSWLDDGPITSLSADGTKLAWTSRQENSEWDIWMKDRSSGREVRVTRSGEQETRPIFSRDGAKVAFLSSRAGHAEVGIVELSTGQRRTVCRDCGYLRDWSADERRLLVVRGDELVEVDSVTGSPRLVVGGPNQEVQEAAYSPDGRWIAATVGIAGEKDLQGIILPAHGGPRSGWIPVTKELHSLALHWSPDGELVYFFSRRDDFRCLWAQPLHRVTKQPKGPPFTVEHFHRSEERVLSFGWASITRNTITVNLSRRTGNLYSLDAK